MRIKNGKWLVSLLFLFCFCCGFRFQEDQIRYTTERVEQNGKVLPPYTEVYVANRENGICRIYREGDYLSVPESSLVPLSAAWSGVEIKGEIPSPMVVSDNKADVIMIGDSRTVHIHDYLHDPVFSYVAQGARGFEWLENVAVPIVETESLKGKKIIIWLGANDIWVDMDIWQNTLNYVNFYNTKCLEWTEQGAEVYIVSVGPVQDCSFINNGRIDAFNTVIRDNLPDKLHYLDISDYLKQTVLLIDEVHYHPITCYQVLHRLEEML